MPFLPQRHVPCQSTGAVSVDRREPGKDVKINGLNYVPYITTTKHSLCTAHRYSIQLTDKQKDIKEIYKLAQERNVETREDIAKAITLRWCLHDTGMAFIPVRHTNFVPRWHRSSHFGMKVR